VALSRPRWQLWAEAEHPSPPVRPECGGGPRGPLGIDHQGRRGRREDGLRVQGDRARDGGGLVEGPFFIEKRHWPLISLTFQLARPASQPAVRSLLPCWLLCSALGSQLSAQSQSTQSLLCSWPRSTFAAANNGMTKRRRRRTRTHGTRAARLAMDRIGGGLERVPLVVLLVVPLRLQGTSNHDFSIFSALDSSH